MKRREENKRAKCKSCPLSIDSLIVFFFLIGIGVKALQIDSLNEEEICKKLQSLLQLDSSSSSSFGRGIDASEVSSYFSLSIVVAKEMLHVGEKREILCRDEADTGVLFFANAF